jgi:hypothetical protein
MFIESTSKVKPRNGFKVVVHEEALHAKRFHEGAVLLKSL